MSIVVSDQGEVLALGLIVNKTAQGDLKLKLFTNDYTPVEGTVVGNFTECTATGYAAKTLTGASWTIATVANVTTASYAAQTFTMSSAANCYGYYVTNSAGTSVLFAEKFPSVFTIPSGGGSVTVTLNWTAD